MTDAFEQAVPMYDEAGRPRFFADPGTDRFAAVLLRLASELWVARERLDTLERLAVQSGVIRHDGMDTYAPDAEAAKQREASRQAFIQAVFAPLREHGQAGAGHAP